MLKTYTYPKYPYARPPEIGASVVRADAQALAAQL